MQQGVPATGEKTLGQGEIGQGLDVEVPSMDRDTMSDGFNVEQDGGMAQEIEL
ncbi:MAG: hypothetical protein WCY67_11705 [Acidithiobacillus sp.]